MERKESQSIGDILRMAFQENCMQERLDECRAVDIWPEIVGKHLNGSYRRPTVRNGLMTVGIPNAALRNELTMTRTLLVRAINSRLGRKVISDIRFTS